MKYLCYYFGQHPEYKKVVYFLGASRGKEELDGLLRTCRFEELYIVYEDKKEAAKAEAVEDATLLSKAKFLNHLDDYSSFAFIVDGYQNQKELFSFAKAKPLALVGSFAYGYDSFALYEAYREFVPTIAISRFVNPLRNEVLEWKKDEFEKELSIIFPVYNVGAYIRKCVETVTAFASPYVEFLFVSDGSKDDSVEILREYAAKDPRILIFEKENGGCASARQYGLERAKGRYIGFVDPDDFVDPTMFPKLLSRALTGGYDIAYSGYKEYYEDSGESQDIDDVIGFPYDLGTTNEELIDDLIAFRRIAIWRGIYSHDLLANNDIRFHEDLPRFDDLPFKVETLARAKSVVSVPEYLYYYRLGRKGQDVAADDRRLYVHFDIFRHLDEFFASARSSRQKDLYRIVKTQTHAWALTRIKSYWREDYREKAAKDLGIKNSRRGWTKAILSYGGKKGVKENECGFIDKNLPITKRTLSLIIDCNEGLDALSDSLKMLSEAPFLRFEAFLLDGGLNPQDKDKLSSLAASDRRFHLLSCKDKNRWEARNLAIGKAKGDYVWFLSSSDAILEQSFAAIEEAFGSKPSDVFAFDYQIRANKGNVLIRAGNYKEGDYYRSYLLGDALHPFGQNKLYALRFLKEQGVRFDARGELAFDVQTIKKATKATTIHRLLCLRKPISDAEEVRLGEELLSLVKGEKLDKDVKSSLSKHLFTLSAKKGGEALANKLTEAGWKKEGE